MKVKGKTPEWKVNPSDYDYNMTIYGKIRINHIFSTDPDDLIAAFRKGKCVGVTHNTYLSKNDLWYAFLTVYSDSVKANHLTFRIWDASTGKIYQAIPNTATIKFVNDTIIGSSDHPVIFDGKKMFFQNIELNKGWNWISFNLYNTELDSINATLNNGIWQSGDIVKHDERGFDQYSSAHGWIGTLNGFDNTSLFKLKTAIAQTLSTNGTVIDVKNTPITVKGNRWNYISYLPPVNMTVQEALADYAASDGDVIKSQTGFSMYSHRNGWVGNLTYMEPGKGYMLYRKDNGTILFHYPNIGGGLNIHRLFEAPNANARLNPGQLPVPDNFNFADNMTLIAIAKGKEFTLQPKDKMKPS